MLQHVEPDRLAHHLTAGTTGEEEASPPRSVSPGPTSPNEPQRPTPDEIWRMWGWMAGRYGGRWTSQRGDAPWYPVCHRCGADRQQDGPCMVCGDPTAPVYAGDGDHWCSELAGLGLDDISLAWPELAPDWPPTPPELRRAVLWVTHPRRWGLPDPDDALRGAQAYLDPATRRRPRLHPVSAEAVTRMGSEAVWQIPPGPSQARQDWVRHYRSAVRDWAAGYPVARSDQLPPPPPTSQDPGVAQAALSRMRRMLEG